MGIALKDRDAFILYNHELRGDRTQHTLQRPMNQPKHSMVRVGIVYDIIYHYGERAIYFDGGHCCFFMGR